MQPRVGVTCDVAPCPRVRANNVLCLTPETCALLQALELSVS